eukprot:TRINITY_DN29208_c0_g1_i1.p1 TRINITY_DN29208_c0_g1~~TRINITY_DN29208_c0_g1_i1.p1  ORF type:complete len:1315 (-),score=229.41 TRINITY_DN29208_c0_g1_i1:121-3717(-)
MAHGVSQPGLCLVFGDLIDSMGGPQNEMMDKMKDLCLTMALIGVGTVVCASIQGACFKLLSDRLSSRWRMLYFDTIVHQDIEWYDIREVAALPGEVNEDLDKIQDAFGDKMGNGIMAISAFAGGFGCAFALGWLIALVMCAILPFLVVGAIVMGKAVQEVQFESQGWYAKASAVVEECLHAMRTVVSFGGEHRELKKFKEATLQTRTGGIRTGFKIGAGMGYTFAIIFLGYALAFYFGMTLRYNGEKNPSTGEEWMPGRILSIFFCVFIGSFMIGNVDPSVKAFQAAQMGAGRFFEMFESKPAIQCRTTDTRKELTGPLQSFTFKDVEFYYPARPDVKVLAGVNLAIQQGQKVALVGESGSGKSSIMALLDRFYDPSSGLVLVNGEDMRLFKTTSVRQKIGYVGQEPVLFATSIRENIMHGAPNATPELFKQACKDAQLDFVDKLPEKYNTFVGSGGSQFSGGQKQRIAIARALIKQSSFLFLDEATSALDNTSEKMIQATIDSISAKTSEGLGIVSIAHRLSTVRNCDIIYVLSRGKVVEQGNHDELMARKGTYYALAASQEAAKSKNEQADAVENAGAKQMERAVSGGSDAKDEKEKGQSEKEREAEIAKKYKVPMGRLFSYNKPEWIFFIPAMIGALGEGSSMPICAILLVNSMDMFFQEKEKMKDGMTNLCIYFCIIAAGQLITSTLNAGCFSILGESMTQRLRVHILSSIFSQEIGFHDDPENTPGMLAKALELYAYRVSNLCKSIGQKAASFSSLATGLTIAFVACWQMSLIMLGSIPVMIAANAIQMIVLLGASKNENSDLKLSQQIVTDAVSNARTVQALVNEKALLELYSAIVKRSLKGIWCRHPIAGFGFGIASGVMFFIMAGGFYFASLLIDSGDADFVSVMTAFMGIFYAGMGAGQSAAMMGDLTKAKVACHDMFKLLDRQSKINGLEPTGETPTALEASVIEFVDVKFFYPFRPQVQVLKGVSFKITKGQSVGLVGPSGGGKSTVMAMLQRFYDPQSGDVLVGNERKPLASLNIRWWRRQLGFVGQEPVLFNTTVRENILYGLDDNEKVSNEHLEACQKMANLGFLFKGGNKGLETQVGPRGGRLSGGQKQRVAICRALIRDPKVLLLDEATSALDTQSELIVQTALQKAMQGRTSFAIAHRLSTVSGSDVIIVVAEGSVVEKGTHSELMDLGGVYAKLQQQSRK